tara:strand:+ start:3136 stop:4446 length:1311 start_codon:yes stop_codon:yes gene_type:complete
MTDTDIVVASYNTSFASDLGKALGSEGNFLAPREGDNLEFNTEVKHNREYFNNAIKQVKEFFEEYGERAVIGLQEINWVTHEDTANNIENKNKSIDETNEGYMYVEKDLIPYRDNQNQENLTGSTQIYHELSKVNKNIAVCVGAVRNGNTQPALIIAFNKTRFGNPKHMIISELNLIEQLGRPIFYVLTDENYLFINLHAPNSMKHTLEHKLQVKVEKKINEIINADDKLNSIDIDKIFIMGDFNDPYNYFKKLTLIRSDKPEEIMSHSKQLGFENYTRQNSCCYNVNSSGTKKVYKIKEYDNNNKVGNIKIRDAYGKKEATFEYELGGRDGPPQFYLTRTNLYKTIGDLGSINNYGFTGDYVFGKNPTSDMEIYKKTPEAISTRSDHEMVYCTYNDISSGGKKSKKVRKYTKRRTPTKKRRRHTKRRRPTKKRRR